MKPICHSSVLVFLLLGCTPEPQPIYPIPQPENLDKVEETRVLLAVQEAQQEVGDKPHSAEAWANLGKFISHTTGMRPPRCVTATPLNLTPMSFAGIFS